MRPLLDPARALALSTLLLAVSACDEPPSKSAAPPASARSHAPAVKGDEHYGMRVRVDSETSSIGSCSSCSALTSHPEGPALSVSHAGSGAGVSVWKTGEGAAVLAHGGRIEVTDEGGVIVVASSARAPAAERIDVAPGVSVVIVEAVPGKQKNVLAIPAGREGQLLWLHDADDDPCVLADDERAVIAPGSVRQLLFLGGRWRPVG